MTQYEAAAAQYQPLFEVLDDLARHTWVLEPATPTYATCSRRISIGMSL